MEAEGQIEQRQKLAVVLVEAIVSGVWFQSGRIFKATGGNMMIRRFKQ